MIQENVSYGLFGVAYDSLSCGFFSSETNTLMHKSLVGRVFLFVSVCLCIC